METTTTSVFLAGNASKNSICLQVPSNMFEHNIAVTINSHKVALSASATIGPALSSTRTNLHCLSANGDTDTTMATVPPNGSNSLFYIPTPHPHAANVLNLFGHTSHTENGFGLYITHGTEMAGTHTFDLTKSRPYKESAEDVSSPALVCVTGSKEVIASLKDAYTPMGVDGDHPVIAVVDATHAVVTMANLVRLTSLATALSATSGHSTIIVSLRNLEKDGGLVSISVDYNSKDPNYKHPDHAIANAIHDTFIKKNTITLTQDDVADIAPSKVPGDNDEHLIQFDGDISRITITPPKTSTLVTNAAEVQPHSLVSRITHSKLGTYLTDRASAFTAVATVCGHYFSHLADTIKSI